MTTPTDGDMVEVHYTGTFADGTTFDSSRGRAPLSFTVGGGQVIPGFDEAVRGLHAGASTTVTIPAEQAYGPRHEALLLRVPRGEFPAEITPEIGMELSVHQEDGGTVPVRVSAVDDASVTLDANHPLAGMDLTFEIELVRVVEP